jgi:GxxExxY protein
MADIIYKEESFEIIGKCMEVYNFLGKGFLEVVYKEALEVEFRDAAIPYRKEHPFEVVYKGVSLPHMFYADFVVMDKIILEIKAVKDIADEHRAQVINYLTASNYKLALLINFGSVGKLQYERFVL